MLFSVVIPMYNERAVIADSLRELADALEAASEAGGWRYEILFSDDGSDDGCGELVHGTAKELILRRGTVAVVRAEENRGKGAAVRLGMLTARGDWRLFTDSDLAYGAEIVPVFLEDALEIQKKNEASGGCGILAGSRAAAKDGYSGYTWMRKTASKVFLKILSLTAGFRCSDSQCGIKLFRGDAAEKIFSLAETDGWAFDFEALMLADRLGFPIYEHPVRILRHRASKIRLFRDSVGMLAEVGRIRKRVREKTAVPGQR